MWACAGSVRHVEGDVVRSFTLYFNTVVLVALAVFLALAASGRLDLSRYGQAEVVRVQLAPTPLFVTPHEPAPKDTPVDYEANGVRIRLMDQQLDMSAAEQVHYYRYVVDVESRMGAEAMSVFYVDFKPAFQTVHVHDVIVTRDGERLDRRNDVFLTRVQAEGHLSSDIVTGLERAMVRVPNLRPGDTLDISYSVSGSQPAFGGDRTGYLWMESATVIERAAVSVRMRGTDPQIQTFGGAPEAEVDRQGAITVLSLPPQRLNPAKPASFFAPAGEPRSWLVSSFESWTDVVDWGLSYYRIGTGDADVRRMADQIQATYQDQSDQITEAIRFVQDEVDYFSMSLGARGYIPAEPGQTLHTLNGDCKDKSVLLAELLTLLGVEARVALVSLYDGFEIEDRVPGPLAFDHAIVQFEYEGRDIWVDATQTYQRGSVERRSEPDYGWALILEDGETALTRMPTSEPATYPLTEVIEHYTVQSDAPFPVSIRNTYIYRDRVADDVRAQLTYYPEADLVDAYAGGMNYGEMSDIDVQVSDDPDLNELRVEVSLEGSHFLPKEAPEGEESLIYGWSAPFLETFDWLQFAVGEEARLYYPDAYRHSVRVELPGDADVWDIPNEATQLDNDVFTYSFNSTYADSVLLLEWDQHIKQPELMVEEHMLELGYPIQQTQTYLLNLDLALERLRP